MEFDPKLMKQMYDNSNFKDGYEQLSLPRHGVVEIEDGYAHLPECTYLGTVMNGQDENAGADMLFLQQLLLGYKSGQLVLKSETEHQCPVCGRIVIQEK